MNVLPVITRELRAQARQPFTFWLRMLGVAALLVCGFLFASDTSFMPNRGGALFGYMHLTLFGAVWLLVPLGAADCLSRERREGTLGLLFLTPLTARDIVVAKGLTHGVRGLTLVLAVLPVLTIPFLLGGVSWQQALASAFVNFSGLCWALAAALIASAYSKNGLRAMALAVSLAALALCIQCYVAGLMAGWSVPGRLRGYPNSPDLQLNLLQAPLPTDLRGREVLPQWWLRRCSPPTSCRCSWPCWDSQSPCGSPRDGCVTPGRTNRPHCARNKWTACFSNPSLAHRCSIGGCGGIWSAIPSAGSNSGAGADGW